MASITLHYNPDCATCVRQARRTASLDWLGRVTVSTVSSPDNEGCDGDACEI